ncbi:MAG: winged helix-turn-helix transcriptional regulator [Thermoplasmata archaeon]|nr:MAG: winged helix-turn-helix transcriptional regulator [Thermoplasmata archaeon]
MEDDLKFRETSYEEFGQEYRMIMSSNFHKTTSSLLLNNTRREIYQYICRFPCSHLTGIARDLKMTPPSIEYHLKKMLKEQLIGTKRIGKKTVYFPDEMVAEEDIPLLALIHDRKAKMILCAVLSSPCLMQKEISRLLALKRQTVRWYIARLKEAGLVDIVEDGVCRRYSPTKLLESKSEVYRNRMKEFKDHVINNLIMDGMNPRIVKNTHNQLIIQIGNGSLDSLLKLVLDPFSVGDFQSMDMYAKVSMPSAKPKFKDIYHKSS